jgi:DNA-binding CsgD family transcriptional regulator
MEHDAALIDLIYEAALEPEMWAVALDQASRRTGARGGVLFAADPAKTRWIASPALQAGMRDFVDQGWLERNTRTARLAGAAHAGYLTDQDIFTSAEMATQPIYGEFLWPRGLRHGAASIIEGPHLDRLVMSFEGFADEDAAQAAKPALDQLRPHFARAGVVAAKLGLTRARGAAAALEALGLGAAVIGPGGRLLAVNALLDAGRGDVVRDGVDRCRLRDRAADALFASALAGETHAVSFPIRDEDGRVRHVGHVLPLRGGGRDLLFGGTALLVVAPIAIRTRPLPELIAVLYDLSPAEARVAALVAEGASGPQVARSLAISPHTVRHHLKSIFAKTGVGRQSELAALLGPAFGVTAPGVK